MNQPPLKRGDGPMCLMLGPTRELAIQCQTVAALFQGAGSGDSKLLNVLLKYLKLLPKTCFPIRQYLAQHKILCNHYFLSVPMDSYR